MAQRGWVTVQSSWVSAINYDPDTKELTVQFKSGVRCQYSDIEESLVDDFLTSGSKGKWVHQHLLKLSYRKV